MKKTMLKILTALLALIALVAVGCAELDTNDPLSSEVSADNPTLVQLAASGTQIKAQVQTTDQACRMLTFYGSPDTVIANHNCEIVRLSNTNESPIPFESIQPGDSVQMNCVQTQNGYMHARRIAAYTGSSCQYDVAFRDTIATIDYEAGSFTVTGLTETIFVDENTEIWNNTTSQQWQLGADDESTRGQGDNGGSGNGGGQPNRTVLAFTDLTVGNVVEVRAVVLESGDLLAVMIKLANCQDPEPACTQFDAVLASVDTDLRVVTFEGLTWNGTVKPGARLLDADGNDLTLADFAAGDTVQVKGVPDPDVENELAICLLQKI